jgi:AhpD family alkylhydroperoxidase
MNRLPILTRENTPEASRIHFDEQREATGQLSNLYAVFAHSPVAFDTFVQASAHMSAGELSLAEREIVYTVASEVNVCHYCISSHTMYATRDAQVSAKMMLRLRKGEPSGNRQYDALARAVRAIGQAKGLGAKLEVEAFFEAGYSPAALVEVVMHMGLNFTCNLLNHVAGTPIDFPLASELPSMSQPSIL